MDQEIRDNTDLNSPKFGYFEKNLKKISNYSYLSLLALVISVILLTFNLRLAAGFLIIADAAFSIFLLRNWISLIKSAGEVLRETSDAGIEKDLLITGFSHKIREPLNNLVIIGDMLMDSGLDKKQRDLIETFVASTNNMVTIVNELTMQSAGNLNFESRKSIKFRLLPTIENTIELFSLKDNSNLNFTISKEEFYDFECFGDPIVLKQLFLAIFNTIEDSSLKNKTTVAIILKSDRKSAHSTLVSITLKTSREINLINETKPESDLVARLIKAGNGSYNIEIGEMFSILNVILPFTTIAEEPKQQIASPKIEELIQKTKTNKELKDLNVLIVEDNLINKKITELTLKPLVKNIDTASNGKEALDKFGSSSYDLILMDIQMPVMSGLLAAEKIRALEASTNNHVPIIAITANAMLGDKEKCISAGIDDYISKPFQPSMLIEKIKSCI